MQVSKAGRSLKTSSLSSKGLLQFQVISRNAQAFIIFEVVVIKVTDSEKQLLEPLETECTQFLHRSRKVVKTPGKG